MKAPNRKTIFTVSVALLVLGISVVIYFALKKDSDLPVYEGKNVREWFYGEDGHPGMMLTMQAAEEAFNKLGTNSIPFLISKLRTEGTLFQKGYCKLFPKLPIRIQKKLPPTIDASYVQQMARHHLEAIPIQRLKPFANKIPELYPRLRNKSYRRGISFLENKSFFQPTKLKDKTSHILTVIEDGDPIVKLDAAILL
jgi:hypothetical protein